MKEILNYEKEVKELMDSGKEMDAINSFNFFLNLLVRDKIWKIYYENREVIPAEKMLLENIEAKKDIFGIVR
jgi:hypothetical protein